MFIRYLFFIEFDEKNTEKLTAVQQSILDFDSLILPRRFNFHITLGSSKYYYYSSQCDKNIEKSDANPKSDFLKEQFEQLKAEVEKAISENPIELDTLVISDFEILSAGHVCATLEPHTGLSNLTDIYKSAYRYH